MTNKKEYNYKLRYNFSASCRPEGYIKKDIETEQQGLCDTLIFLSILHPPDGSYSQTQMGIDGRTNSKVSSIDLFKAWSMMGMQLSGDDELNGWQKQIVEEFARVMRETIKELSK